MKSSHSEGGAGWIWNSKFIPGALLVARISPIQNWLTQRRWSSLPYQVGNENYSSTHVGKSNKNKSKCWQFKKCFCAHLCFLVRAMGDWKLRYSGGGPGKLQWRTRSGGVRWAWGRESELGFYSQHWFPMNVTFNIPTLKLPPFYRGPCDSSFWWFIWLRVDPYDYCQVP